MKLIFTELVLNQTIHVKHLILTIQSAVVQLKVQL